MNVANLASFFVKSVQFFRTVSYCDSCSRLKGVEELYDLTHFRAIFAH